jgi:hypothetical protein
LPLAFRDRERITLDGPTILEESARREIWVCGPGAYVVLKALAFRSRGENKDAYDLFYILENFGRGVSEGAEHFRLLLDDPATEAAVAVLEQDFASHEGIGPRRVAEFITGGPDDAIQARSGASGNSSVQAPCASH